MVGMMKQVTILTVVGSILVVLCSIFLGVFPTIFSSIVDKMLVVREDSSTFKDFISPPVPVYMQFFMFNVTNPNGIRFKGEKPRVQEIGPYTYEEVRTKHDLRWDTDAGTVEYLQDKSFFFVENMSNGLSESDLITTINPIMVVVAENFNSLLQAAETAKEEGDEQQGSMKVVLDTIWSELEAGFNLFSTHAVGDMLFYGFDLPKFDFDFSALPDINNLTHLLGETEGLNGTLYDILSTLKLSPPEILKANQINFMKNNTDDKTYEVKTGAKGVDDYLKIVKWDGKTHLNYWNDTYCDMVNGTDGTQYPPKVTKDRTLYLYTSELCRSLFLTYEKETDVLGISTYRFIPPKEVLEDPMVNEDNKCFCVPDVDHCLRASMLNMGPCAFDAPIILSTPHFYQGDPKDINAIDGINPLKAQHETFLDVEPNTGVAMWAMKKMQLNVPLRRYGSLPSFMNVPEVIFPLVWVNESAQISPSMANDLKKALYMPFTIVDAICGTLMCIGALLLLVAAYKFIGVRRARNQQKI